MTQLLTKKHLSIAAAAVACVTSFAGESSAQSSSLMGAPGERTPLTLEDSFFYVPAPPQKEIGLNSIITVVVDFQSQVISESDLERRERTNMDARLQDWIALDGLSIEPAAQASGDPRARASLQTQLRNEADLESRDGMKFRIAAVVVDIRPNGNLIIEAHREIKNNDETWEQSLTGTIRAEDILPNNTVLSEDVYGLRIDKREVGEVRDGARRGWLLKFLDHIQPF